MGPNCSQGQVRTSLFTSRLQHLSGLLPPIIHPPCLPKTSPCISNSQSFGQAVSSAHLSPSCPSDPTFEMFFVVRSDLCLLIVLASQSLEHTVLGAVVPRELSPGRAVSMAFQPYAWRAALISQMRKLRPDRARACPKATHKWHSWVSNPGSLRIPPSPIHRAACEGVRSLARAPMSSGGEEIRGPGVC